MKRLFKIILWIVGLIVAVFVGAFLYGAVLGLTGQPSPRPKTVLSPPIDSHDTAAPGTEDQGAEISTTERSKADPATSDSASNSAPLSALHPEDLTDTRAVVDYLNREGLIFAKDGIISVRPQRFARLDADTAGQIYRAIERTDPQNKYQFIRTLFFAGCANMPAAQLKVFSDQAGPVFRPSMLSARNRKGDFTALFYMHSQDAYRAISERAITAYAPHLSDKEIIGALTDFGVIEEYRTRSDLNSPTKWRLHTYDKLYPFGEGALQAVHDAISDTVLGDRPTLRKQLRALINKSPALPVPGKGEDDKDGETP